MKSIEQIQAEIELNETELKQFYASLAEYYCELKSCNPINESRVPYYSKVKNISAIYYHDYTNLIEQEKMDLEDCHTLLCVALGETVIQYKNSDKLYFVHTELIDSKMGMDWTREYVINAKNIQNKISILKNIIN